MDCNIKKEMLKSIDTTRESIKNNFEITTETYTEILSKLDLLTFLIMNDKETKIQC